MAPAMNPGINPYHGKTNRAASLMIPLRKRKDPSRPNTITPTITLEAKARIALTNVRTPFALTTFNLSRP